MDEGICRPVGYVDRHNGTANNQSRVSCVALPRVTVRRVLALEEGGVHAPLFFVDVHADRRASSRMAGALLALRARRYGGCGRSG